MLIECVPNISEGVDEAVIGDIVSSIKTVKVSNLHSDPDHNRSVITFFGNPDEVVNASLELAERAMQLLDIREHQGVHPFIGVVDVIPFVPYKDASMEDAIRCAHDLGKLLWQKLKLPVYYYGNAAKVKERQELPYVRKGGFAALRRHIELPERKPDEGHGLHVSAGAAAVGARDYLIAFNVNIKTNDFTIAQSIAKNMRESHGGLKGVRSLGFYLQSRGISQISMNIVDHKETSLRQAFDEAQKWAKEYGVKILESELVGMLPKEAYSAGLEKELKIVNFSESLII